MKKEKDEKEIFNKLNCYLNFYKGDKYEEYICEYLSKQPNNKAWLWKDVPVIELKNAKLITEEQFKKLDTTEINTISDYGIDIVVKNNNKYIFVQCKNFSKCVYEYSLYTFLNLMKKYKDTQGIIFYTTKISIKLQMKLMNSKNIKIMHMPFSNERQYVNQCNSVKIKLLKNITNGSIKVNDKKKDFNIEREIERVLKKKIKKEVENEILENEKRTITYDKNIIAGENKKTYYIQEIEIFINQNNKFPSINKNNYYESKLRHFVDTELVNSNFKLWNEFIDRYRIITEKHTEPI